MLERVSILLMPLLNLAFGGVAHYIVFVALHS